MSEQYYGVEPYTGKIICHYRTPNSRNGYSFGKLVDPDKVAKGKIYDADISDIKKNDKAIDSARKAYYDAANKFYNKTAKTYTKDWKNNTYKETDKTRNQRENVERLERLYKALKKNRPHSKMKSSMKDKYYKIRNWISGLIGKEGDVKYSDSFKMW